jgi:hypothetical protein
MKYIIVTNNLNFIPNVFFSSGVCSWRMCGGIPEHIRIAIDRERRSAQGEKAGSTP